MEIPQRQQARDQRSRLLPAADGNCSHRGLFDAVFFSDHPALMTEPLGRPFHTIDPLILCTALAAQVPDIGFVS
jgi:alkanesulfonate monooxygenase SsuD/methylene tetrahydromethanopterin reductase-like flavin-dependent oxidoreductase (luciferase family)